jgi:hypothetical protein
MSALYNFYPKTILIFTTKMVCSGPSSKIIRLRPVDGEVDYGQEVRKQQGVNPPLYRHLASHLHSETLVGC